MGLLLVSHKDAYRHFFSCYSSEEGLSRSCGRAFLIWSKNLHDNLTCCMRERLIHPAAAGQNSDLQVAGMTEWISRENHTDHNHHQETPSQFLRV